jgi:hypothetical protein
MACHVNHCTKLCSWPCSSTDFDNSLTCNAGDSHSLNFNGGIVVDFVFEGIKFGYCLILFS